MEKRKNTERKQRTTHYSCRKILRERKRLPLYPGHHGAGLPLFTAWTHDDPSRGRTWRTSKKSEGTDGIHTRVGYNREMFRSTLVLVISFVEAAQLACLTPAISEIFEPAARNPMTPPRRTRIPYGMVRQKSCMARSLFKDHSVRRS